jgi:hypothetical protein
MSELEHEQPLDDREVELTPLDAPGTVNAPTLPRWLAFARMSVRQRRVTLRIALAVCVLVFSVLALPGGGLTSMYRLTSGLFKQRAASPVAASAPALANTDFYLDASLPWTSVSLDGRAVQLPRISRDAPLRLSHGTHAVSWMATPFPAQTCRVSVPARLDDTCRFAAEELDAQALDPFAQILLLNERVSALPARQQDALVDDIQRALAAESAKQPVQKGDMYAGPRGFEKATQPLQATLHFRYDPLATANPPYTFEGEDCLQLCLVPWRYLSAVYATPPASATWFSLAFITSTWSYVTRDGRDVARDVPLDFANAARATFPILLRITWQAVGWRVEPLIGRAQAPPIVVGSDVLHYHDAPTSIHLADDPACVAARDVLSWMSYSGVEVSFMYGPNPAAGCLAVIADARHGTAATFLEHLGVLLALNPAAHRYLAGIPTASAYERGLAGQMVSRAEGQGGSA